MSQYIHDNTEDEFTHCTFINAYLRAHGQDTVELDSFRTLPSSTADGAQQIGRPTNGVGPVEGKPGRPRRRPDRRQRPSPAVWCARASRRRRRV